MLNTVEQWVNNNHNDSFLFKPTKATKTDKLKSSPMKCTSACKMAAKYFISSFFAIFVIMVV